MKNVGFKYAVLNKQMHPQFLSDATTLDELIEDTKQYFRDHPAGHLDYEMKVIKNKNSDLLDGTQIIKRIGISKAEVHYFVLSIVHITKDIPVIDAKWEQQEDNCQSVTIIDANYIK